MINIKSFGKKRDNTSTVISNTGFSNSTNNKTNVNGVYVWGQYHDHTSDIDGDITTSGSISAQGSITTPSDINGANLSLSGGISCDDIQCDDINSSGDLHTTDIQCANINCLGDIDTDTITANEGTITTLVADYLTVTKQAHFFELIIDKIKSNAGQVILSAANAVLDKVTTTANGYKLYWRREDPTTHKKIGNDFALNDQIRCQTFNVHEGTNFNVDNKYYWRLVTDTGTESVTIDGEQVDCNYIEVSDTDKDGTSIPEVGDEICQLGNRTDTSRQNAIILSACASLDPNVTAPSIVQYRGINSYTLNGKILNQMAANGNTFTGNFMVVNGSTTDNVLDLITGTMPTIKTDTDASFLMVNSTSEMTSIDDAQNLPTNIQLFDGSTQIPYSSWTTNSYIKNDWQQVPLKPLNTYSDTGLYIAEIMSDGAGGVDVDWNFSQDYGLYTNYSIEIYIEWTDGVNTYHTTKTIPVNVLVQSNSPAGSDAEFDRLQILSGDATVGVNDTLTVGFTAQIQHIKGNVITQVTDLSTWSMDVTYNNNGGMYTATKDNVNHRFVFTDTVTDFSQQATIPTNITFTLVKQSSGQFIMVDTALIPIKFDAGSIFEVKEDAITAAVTSSNGYTDGQIATVNLTAQGLNTRVTAIENDYVTSSELTQTANQISLNVYDELRNKTGIDVQAGQITLNANNTTINGNLNLNNTDNGITVYDEDGTPRIQIQPNEIGSIDDFDSGTSYIVKSSIRAQNASTYSQTTAIRKIGLFAAGDTLTMKSMKAFLTSAGSGGNVQNPTDTFTAVIQLFQQTRTDAPITTFSKTFTYNSTLGVHTTSDITYTIPINGAYSFNAIITYNSQPLESLYEEVYCTVDQTITHQTYIGSDGFYCNPYSNAMLWAGSEEIQMRWGYTGIRVNDDGVQRMPHHYIQQNQLWLPIDNYTVVTNIIDSMYTLVGTEYRYTINPVTDLGVLMCSVPSFNTGGYTTHVFVPPYEFTHDGKTYRLPQGYKVTIYNADWTEGSVADRMYLNVHFNNISRQVYGVGGKINLIHIGNGSWVY